MKAHILSFAILALASAKSPPIEPRITYEAAKSREGIPNVNIIFPDGHEDSFVLERHYASPEHRMSGELHCNFIGHLKNEKSACVAVTGCYDREDVELTIHSKHNTDANMYVLRKDGSVKSIESNFKNHESVRGGYINKDDDELINEEELDNELDFLKLCNSGDCSSMPDKQSMKIKIGYDDTWHNSFGGDTSASTTYINSMITHMQAWMCLDSLGTKIDLETTGDYTYHQGQSWKAEPDSNSLQGPIKDLTSASTANANLWVYLCKDTEFYGVVGLAYVGSLCYSKSYSCGVNEKRGNLVSTAEVVIHEMGHNMGMLHDFDETHGGDNGPCNGQGFLSYGSAPQQWSTCSKNDFLALYNSIVASNNKYWCLPYADTACGSAPSPPPPSPSPPSPSPPSPSPPAGSCATMPQFMQDANRIVGGEAAPSMIPWQVAMLSNGWQFCGGTILDACTILSARHCFTSTSTSGKTIRAGSTNKYSGGQTRGISQVIWDTANPYNSQTLNNDWVILKLDSPLELNDDVLPACLPSSSWMPENTAAVAERCFTSGWGTLSSGGSSTSNLQYVRVPAITNAVCNNYYSGSITDPMICAGYPGVGGKDACQGDSGGPFICQDGTDAVITGVVSWGIGCAEAQYPGVYARATTALNFIQNNMGCSSTPSPPSPSPSPPSPSPSPPSNGCGSPQWQGDGYCDDDNNNEGCAYDGGDCCGNDVQTTYCSACQCLACTDNYPGWWGDGICDDGNNNEGCNWDGGDCCMGSSQNNNWCTVCACLDPDSPNYSTTSAPSACGSPQWKGDGFCDDDNNNDACDFDGGDCCGDNVQTTYCSACQCLACADNYPTWWGDNICDDGNNNVGCNWDGGDCCMGASQNNNWCTVCACLDPSAPQSGDGCGSPQWKGDGYCDDDNNNDNCDYDGGDCCGNDVQTTFCSACQCLACADNYPNWWGDGICDDGNNNQGCNYDGGDCCMGSSQNNSWCTVCACLDPNA